MAVADNSYSRFVQIAKIALPLIALGLLSTLFLFSSSVDPENAIPFVEGDVEAIAESQKIAAPRLSGVTSDGDSVTVTASYATPEAENPRNISIHDVQARVTLGSGNHIDISAAEAHYDGTDERVTLTGNVDITTTTGYRLKSDELRTSLAETHILSPGQVTGTAPSGRLEAGRMEIEARGQAQVLVFNGGVKLVYQPQK